MKVHELHAALGGACPFGMLIEREVTHPPAAGFGEIAGIELQLRQVEDGIGVIAIDFDRSPQMPPGRVRAPTFAHQPGKIEPGFDEARIELYGAGIVMRRFGLPPGGSEAVGPVERCNLVGAVDGEIALVERGRLVVFPASSAASA